MLSASSFHGIFVASHSSTFCSLLNKFEIASCLSSGRSFLMNELTKGWIKNIH